MLGCESESQLVMDTPVPLFVVYFTLYLLLSSYCKVDTTVVDSL